MSSEWRAPAPLPMYQPVVLKHVPTMVRRRYDHLDVHTLTSDQPQPQPQGSVSEHDGCDRSEMEHLGFIVDTDVKDETLDHGPQYSSDDQDSCQSQDDSQHDYNLRGEVDASASVEGHHSRLGNSTDDRVTRTYSESIGNVSTGQTDLDPENSKSKDDGSYAGNHALIMDSTPHEDESHEAKHKILASFSKEQDSKFSKNDFNGPKVADHAPTMVTGGRASPPLPMYHPVALHHVPTMVRRRYEHFDTDKLDQIEDAPKNDGKFEDNGDMDSINDEDNLGSENSSCEQGSALEDNNWDGSDMEHSSRIIDTSVKGWRGSGDDDLQGSNPSSEVDDGISVECQLNGEENSTDNCASGTYCENVGTRSITPTELDSKDSKIKDEKSKVANHAPVVDSNLDEDEIKHKRLAFLSNEQGSSSEENKIFKTEALKKSIEEDRCKFQGRCSPPPLPMYLPVALKHVPTMVRSRYERSDAEPLHQIEDEPTIDGGIQDDGDLDDEDGLLSENISSEQVECQQSEVENSIDDCETGIYNECVSSRDIQPTDLHSENSESQDDESKVANNASIVDSNLDDGETQDKRQYSERKDDVPKSAYHAPIADSNFGHEIQFDFGNEQGDSKDEYNGAEDAKTASYPSAKHESLDMTDGNPADEQGLLLEDNKRDGDLSEGDSSSCTTASLKSEAEVIECGSFDDDKQDTITQTYTEDSETIRRRSLDKMNLKSGSNGTEDANSTYNMHTAVKTEVQDELSQWHSNYQKEFKPETLKKIMEENGYELCCPYCKHCFTNTLIVQRKENNQHCRIGCFTSLIALFCCGGD